MLTLFVPPNISCRNYLRNVELYSEVKRLTIWICLST